MEHRAEARIDCTAIASNISTLKSKSGVALLAVVKADAYGHGLIETGLVAEKSGADWLGVALLEEAISLRTHGVRIPILAWLLPPGSDFKTAHNHDMLRLLRSSTKSVHLSHKYAYISKLIPE